MNSPLTDPPVSKRLQGSAGRSSLRPPVTGNSNGAVIADPATRAIDIAKNKMGSGTSGRKGFPNLGM